MEMGTGEMKGGDPDIFNGYDDEGLFWGDGSIKSKLKKFFFGLPLILVNFVTGFDLFNPIITMLGITDGIFFPITRAFSFTPAFIPALFGDGSLTGNSWKTTSDSLSEKSETNNQDYSVGGIIFKIVKGAFNVFTLNWPIGFKLGTIFNPVDWNLMKAIHDQDQDQNKDKNITSLFTELFYQKKGENVQWNGVYPYWLKITVILYVISIVTNGIILSGLSTPVYMAFLLGIVGLMGMFVVGAISNNCQDREAIQLPSVNLPCSNIKDPSLRTLYLNIKNFVEKSEVTQNKQSPSTPPVLPSSSPSLSTIPSEEMKNNRT
jgi:hypothetical protein